MNIKLTGTHVVLSACPSVSLCVPVSLIFMKWSVEIFEMVKMVEVVEIFDWVE